MRIKIDMKVKIVTFLKSLYLERRCLLCTTPFVHAHDVLCLSCRKDLYIEKRQCKKCGFLLENKGEYCSFCLENKTPWTTFAFSTCYDGQIIKYLHQLKFYQNTNSLKLFELLLIDAFSCSFHKNTFPDIIIPVPIHKKRLFKRGINHSLVLANKMKDTGILVDKNILLRIKNTPVQHKLKRKQRLLNLKNAFHVQGDLVKGKHILLLDDVYTTGATIKECIEILKKAGAREVSVLVVAVTPLERKSSGELKKNEK